jgi:hypothetical protein
MPYNQNIPQPTDSLNQSQPQLLGNFQSIDTLINVNHVDFDDPSGDQGKHKWVSFPVQAVPPATLATELALFSELSAITGNNELAVRLPSNGAIYEFTSSGAAANGWTRLPSGILIKWGDSATIPGAQTINFPVAANIPVFSSIFQVITSTRNNASVDSFVTLNSFTTTGISVYSSQRTTNSTAASRFTYLAIGI